MPSTVPNVLTTDTYVEAPIDDAAIAALGRDKTQGKITIVDDGTGSSLGLPLSLKGFDEADAAVSALARQKIATAMPNTGPKP